MFVERLTRDPDYMRLANFQRVRSFDAEWKVLRRPSKDSLANLTPLSANGNLGANRSGVVSGRINKRDMNVAVCFDLSVNDATSQRVPFLLRRHSRFCVLR